MILIIVAKVYVRYICQKRKEKKDSSSRGWWSACAYIYIHTLWKATFEL